MSGKIMYNGDSECYVGGAIRCRWDIDIYLSDHEGSCRFQIIFESTKQ